MSAAEHVGKFSYLDKIKGPVSLNLELAPSVGICDVPLRPKRKQSRLALPRHLFETLDRARHAEVLTFTAAIPDILLIFNDDGDVTGELSREINKTGALLSLNTAIPSKESALKLKSNVVDFGARLRGLGLDCFVLYVDLELLPIISGEIGRLAKFLLEDSLTFFSLCSDLPRTTAHMESLAINTKEVARISGMVGMGASLMNTNSTACHNVLEIVSGLGQRGLIGSVVLKPPLPACLLRSPHMKGDSPISTGVCAARHISLTVEASGMCIPCLYRRNPSFANLDTVLHSWDEYRGRVAGIVGRRNFRMLESCRICDDVKHCGGLCDIWTY